MHIVTYQCTMYSRHRSFDRGSVYAHPALSPPKILRDGHPPRFCCAVAIGAAAATFTATISRRPLRMRRPRIPASTVAPTCISLRAGRPGRGVARLRARISARADCRYCSEIIDVNVRPFGGFIVRVTRGRIGRVLIEAHFRVIVNRREV